MSAEGFAVTTSPLPASPSALNRGIVRAAGSLALAAAAVKGVAIFKEMVVAAAFGRSNAMDAFLAAFLIPNLLINLVAESMNQALIPVIVRVRLCEGIAAARRLFSNALCVAGAILSAASLAMALAAHAFFPLIAARFSPSKLDLAIRLFYVLLPCVVLGGIASVCTAVLNTADRFGMPALAPIAISAGMIAATLAWHGKMGIWALALGMLAGTGAQAVVLGAATRAHGYPLRLRWYGPDAPIREVAHRFWPLFLSSVVASGGLLVDQAMAAMLPSGSLSALVFASRFVSVALALVGGAISTALGPGFAALVARRDWPACRAAIRTWSLRSAAVAIPAAVILILAAPILVRVTLQHGSFAAHDSQAVAPVLAMYAIQIPFFVVSRVFYRFLVALGRNDLIFLCGAMNLVLDIALNVVLMRIMGVAGIALATSLWTIATFAFLAFWTARLLANLREAGS